MADLVKTCDVVAGIAAQAGSRATVGHLRQLVIGDAVIAPDLQVASLGSPPGAGSVVVGVLSSVSWAEASPVGPIELVAEVSAANRQQLMAFATMLRKTVTQVAFVVHEFDAVRATFYPSFATKQGAAPGPQRPGGPTGPSPVGPSEGQVPIYAIVAAADISIEPTPSGAMPGMTTHRLRLRLNPAVAPQPQQLLVQTSAVNKAIKTFGLPQA